MDFHQEDIMNAKFASLGLALCALATLSLAPAEARNNSQQALLNQIAMNNYLNANANNAALAAQAQAQAYNPLQATLASYNQPYGYGGNYGGCDRDGDGDRFHHHNGWGNNLNNGYNGYNGNGYNNVVGNLVNGYGNNGFTIAQKIANIQNRLAAGNLSNGQVNKLENKLAQLQSQAGVTGYAPYGYNVNGYGNGNGYVNGVRRFLGI